MIRNVMLAVLLAAGLGACATRDDDDGDFRQIVQGAKDKVFPAVVFIKVIRQNLGGGSASSQEVSGSGVVISPDGEVVSNWHVVDKAVAVRCLASDGRSFKATVVGSDKDTDLALLRLEGAATAALPFARFGDSAALREGDFVMTMGAPYGLSRSVAMGIVSCTRRYLPDHSEYSLWLQTDAAINPGNSGGPLVNTAGEVIGINTLGMASGDGMGFAVPSATVQDVIARLREAGAVRWTWTGIQLQPLRDFNRNIVFEAADGVVVAGTDADSPGREAGLQPRDRILAIAGEPCTATTEEDLPAVQRRLGRLAEGQAVALTVARGAARLDLRMTPRAKGQVEGDERDFPRFDLTAKAINQFANPELYFHRPKGVFIFGCKQPGNAAASGLRPQDIILTVGRREVVGLDDLAAAHAEAVAGIDKQARVVVSVLRGGLRQQFVLDFARDYKKE